jgi:RHS repeat-associated protein
MTFGYDLNGNMTSRNGQTIAWTRYNLPSRIDGAGGAYSEFLYGGDRSRYVQKEDDGTSLHTRHYAAPGLFEAVYAGTSHLVDYQYVHADGHAVAQITTTSSGDDTKYLHRDHQGSVVATTDTSGTVLDRFEYDPFGVRTVTVGSEDGNHRGYTGHEHLAALDVIHMNGRVQDPLLGRFLSADPTVQAPYYSQSLNRYSYVWNNPLTFIDPSGFTCTGTNVQDCTPEELKRLECVQNPYADGCVKQVWLGDYRDGRETVPGEEPREERSGTWCIWSCTRMDGAGVPDTGGFTFAVGDGSSGSDGGSPQGGFPNGAFYGVPAFVDTGATAIASNTMKEIVLASRVATGIGGVLVWNKTADDDTCEDGGCRGQYVVRGGLSMPESFRVDELTRLGLPGRYGVSVSTAPNLSVEQIAMVAQYPHPKITYTYLQNIRMAGFEVVPTPTGNPLHASIILPAGQTDLTPAQRAILSGNFRMNTLNNPARLP